MDEQQEPGQVPKLEDLKAERARLESEIEELNNQLSDTDNQMARIRGNIVESDKILKADLGQMHAEHKGTYSGFLDKVFKKKVDGGEQLHTSLKKLEAVQGYLKSEIRSKRSKAEVLRKTINELDSIRMVADAATCGMEFFKGAEELLKKYEAFQNATRMCSEDEITKHLPGLNFPTVLLVYFTSHFKPTQVHDVAMYQAISNAMRLTAWGKPLIAQRAHEMYKASGNRGQENHPLVREAY